MAKLVKKSKCKFEQGIIVKKNKQIGLPSAVYYELNKLELITQQYLYLVDQPAYQAGPSLEGFERISILETELPYVEEPDTPVCDARVEEAMKFMEEVDALNNVNEINESIKDFASLIKWCDSDKFIEGDCHKPLDLAMVGNPLELTSEHIIKMLAKIIESPVQLED